MTLALRTLLIAGCLPLPLFAAEVESDALPLIDAVLRAPAVAAARARVDAARTRVEGAGRLADPEVETMVSRIDAMRDGERWEVMARQPLPKRGERAADRERARAEVSLAEAEVTMLAADLAAETAGLLAEAEGASARAVLIEAQIERLEAALDALATRMAVGVGAKLTDRLLIQTRMSALELSLEQARKSAGDAEAALRGQLGLPPKGPLPRFSAPEAAEISPTASAALAASEARVERAQADESIARAGARPQTAVGLRLERERGGMGDADMVGVAFSSEIPWRSRRYARTEIQAAGRDRAAARADAETARLRLTSALSEVERADRVAVTARRLAHETQKRLDAEHQTLIRATAAGAGMNGGESAVMHAIDVADKTTETQLEILEADTAARVARAKLWRYAPASRFGE